MASYNVSDFATVATKLFGGTVLASVLLTGAANAMLPTPEPALEESAGQEESTNVIQTKTVAALVSVDANGQPALTPIDENTRLQKGNVIEYQSYFTNTGKDRLRSMTVSMSIPDEVQLMGDVNPSIAFGSVDGQNFSRMPLHGTINGVMQEVPLEYYKGLRWTIEGLGVNETAVVKYRTLVK